MKPITQWVRDRFKAEWTTNGKHLNILASYLLLTVGGVTLLAARPLPSRAAIVAALHGVSYWIFVATLLTLVGAVLALAIFRGPKTKAFALWIGVAWGLSYVAFFPSLVATTSLRLDNDMRLQVGPNFVRIGGAIGPSLLPQLQGMLHPSLPLDYVVLSNGGGSVDAALETAAWLRAKGVRKAIVEGDCSSACSFLALLLPERYLARGAALGFHDVSSTQGKSAARNRDALLTQFAANGLDRTLLDSLLVGRKIVFVDTAFALKHQLVTGCWDTEAKAPVTCSAEDRAEQPR